jgi:hypothetical protein
MARLVLIFSIACFVIFVFVKKAMTEFPNVPPLEMALDWKPMPDRTMQVDFEGVSFRYEILDEKPAPHCSSVLRLPHNELRWVTRPSNQAHQYLTKGEPLLYRRFGDTEWLWLSLKTYKDCVKYDSDKLECKKSH